MSENVTHLQRWTSTETVQAGEITEVQLAGCMVRFDDAISRFLAYPSSWGVRRPQPGDMWLLYDDGFATFSPRWAFDENYKPNR